jgi:hypothetical protein
MWCPRHSIPYSDPDVTSCRGTDPPQDLPKKLAGVCDRPHTPTTRGRDRTPGHGGGSRGGRSRSSHRAGRAGRHRRARRGNPSTASGAPSRGPQAAAGGPASAQAGPGDDAPPDRLAVGDELVDQLGRKRRRIIEIRRIVQPRQLVKPRLRRRRRLRRWGRQQRLSAAAVGQGAWPTSGGQVGEPGEVGRCRASHAARLKSSALACPRQPNTAAAVTEATSL